MPPGQKSHKTIEIGSAFYNKKYPSTFPISDFPEVEELISKAHSAFNHAEPSWERINIIVRSYSVGGMLKAHVDRPDLFGEDVYTCVLANTSCSNLTFHAPVELKWGESDMKYCLPEQAGICVALSGPARLEWKHEVPRLLQGKRHSIS